MDNNILELYNCIINSTFLKRYKDVSSTDIDDVIIINTLEELLEITNIKDIDNYCTQISGTMDFTNGKFIIKPNSFIVPYSEGYYIPYISDDYNIHIYDIILDIRTIVLYNEQSKSTDYKLDLKGIMLYEKMKKMKKGM